MKTIVVTGAGTTATVNASSTNSPLVTGKLHSVYLDYGSVTSTTNVTISTDVGTIFTLNDNATDGWYYPRAYLHTQSGSAHVGTAGVAMFPVTSWLRVSVSSSSPSVTALTAHLFIEGD